MATLAEAIESYVREVGGPVTSEAIRRELSSRFPDQWKPATYSGHLYGCVVNNPKAYLHHPSFKKFLYRRADGTLELYDETKHGPNEWLPVEADDESETVVELAESSIGLERDLEEHLVHHLEGIEAGLTLVDRQVSVEVGRIDILAKDRSGCTVIVEIKVGEAKDSAIGQIARYIGWYTRADGKPPKAVLIASSFPDAMRYAASAIPNLRLVAYRVSFSFEEVKL